MSVQVDFVIEYGESAGVFNSCHELYGVPHE